MRFFILFIATISFVQFNSFGQYRNFNTENERWFDGEIYPTSGKKLAGEVNYNFVTDILKVKEGDDEVIYIPKQIVKFNIYSKDREEKSYYALPLKLEETDREGFHFFEVIHEENHIALLSRFNIKFKKYKQNAGATVNNVGAFIPVVQNIEKVTRSIYLAVGSSGIHPILEAKVKSVGNFQVFDHEPYEKGQGLNESITSKDQLKYKEIYIGKPSRLFNNHTDEVSTYIKENDPDLKSLNGWIELINYQKTL